MFHQTGQPTGENNRRASNALPPATVRKRLFPTPLPSRNLKALRPSLSSTSAAHENPKDLLHTPLPPIPPSSTSRSFAPSSLRRSSQARPSIASLKGTPSLRKRYVEDNPEIWLQRQAEDLTAWLNHELGDASESLSYVPASAFATSDIFVANYASLLRFCNDTTFRTDVRRLGKRVREANLSFSPDINLATEPSKFEQFVSLLTFSYNPTWLLLGLSVILRTNFASQIDQILKQTENAAERVGIAALLNQLVDHILRTQFAVEKPILSQFTLKSPRATCVLPSGVAAVEQNGLVLHRALLLLLLLDQASRDRDVTSNIRMSLFKAGSSVHKSQEVLGRLSKICMSDPTPLNLFLSNRGYRLEYDCPLWKRSSSFVVRDLSTDLRDGIRLCRLAGLLTGDPQMQQQVKYGLQSCTSDMKRMDRYSLNVMMALDSIKTYASKRLGAKVHWNASVKDIIEGNVSKTVALLWQIVELWIEAKLLNPQLLQEKLAEAQNEFRSKAADATWCSSPGAFQELSPSIRSPSRLVIYEQSDKSCIHKLLMWCAAVCGIHRIKVVDFTESFRDCVVLCIMLNHLHPHALDMDAIIRVPPAELREEQDSLKELEIVQSNIAQFQNACERLGAMPSLSISAKASLAPAFISELKEESFGRLMVLMTAYIFNRAQMGRNEKENLEYVHQFAEDWDDFSYTESPSARNVDMGLFGRSTSLTPSSQLSEDSGTTLADERYGLEDEDMPSVHVASVDLSSPLTSQVANSKECSPIAVGTPLGHSKTTPSDGVGGSSSTRSAGIDSEETRKERAAKVIFSNYKAFQVRKRTMNDKDSAVLVQSAVRGFLARCEHENLVRRKERFAKSLEGEFWSRKSLAPSEDILASKGGLYNTQEENEEALKGYRLCSKSLEDVGKAMVLLPSHLKKIDEYVQAMLSHEHGMRTEKTHDELPTEVDAFPDVGARIDPTASENSPQAISRSSLIDTMEDREPLVQNQQTPSSHLLKRSIDQSSPGAEHEVFQTPWTTFRPRPGIRNYAETPSDRFSWYTASPGIRDSSILEDEPYETLAGIVQHQSSNARENSLAPIRTLESGASEVNDGRVDGEQNPSVAKSHFSKGILSSAVATIGRTAYQFLLQRSELASDIVARAAYDADLAAQENSQSQRKLRDTLVSNETTQGVVHGVLPGSRSEFDVGMGHENDGGDIPSADESNRQEEFARPDPLGQDSDSSTDSGDPGDELLRFTGSDDIESEGVTNSQYNAESVNPVQNNVPETTVVASEKLVSEDTFKTDLEDVGEPASPTGSNGGFCPNSDTSLFVDSPPDGKVQIHAHTPCSPSTSHLLDHDPVKDSARESIGGFSEQERCGDDVQTAHTDMVGETGVEEEMRTCIEEALSSAEAAFENHMERTQARRDFDARRRIEIDMRYKELDEAGIASMKRLKHEQERLEASRKGLDERFMTAELPVSIDFESEECVALLDHDSSSESSSPLAANEVEHELDALDAMLSVRRTEDEGIDRELLELECERDLICRKLNNSIESLSQTILTASCFLAERSYTEYMNEIMLKRVQERLNSEQERHALHELFQNSMWSYRLKLARIEGDKKELEDAVASLDERLEDTGSNVFQLLEADIDSKLMLIDHAEERESERVKAALLMRDQTREKLLDSERLIQSYQELHIQDVEEELQSGAEGCDSTAFEQHESNDSVKETRDSLPQYAERDALEMSERNVSTPDGSLRAFTTSQSERPPTSCGNEEKDSGELENIEWDKDRDDRVDVLPDRDNRESFENLAVQLSAFNINSSRKSVENVMSNPSSASKLRALIRRISTATASPMHRFSSSTKQNGPARQSLVCQNIIRTVLVVMRYLHRTPTHIRLIHLGMRIVHDFCEVQNRVADLISVENCIDVLVTCAQFYRDQENILMSAVSILKSVSDDDSGLVLMRKSRPALRRLEAINHLLHTAAEQERKNRYRVQYAKMIVEQVRLSRTGRKRHHLLRDHLAAAERTNALPELIIRPSHAVLLSLLSELKSEGIL
ncbi:Calponiny (CH) [Gracilaria domingensis]|nr:Calponiny (CH) [Gracilaria domingensis]